MKYKVTNKELKECIAEAVVRVIKENFEDDVVRQAMMDPRARKAASREINKEVSDSDKEDEKLNNLEKSAMDTSDEETVNNDIDIRNMSYEDLLELAKSPKHATQLRVIKSELYLRDNIKREFEEEGVNNIYGYTIDDNGYVQPTHTQVGVKNTDAWIGRGMNNGGTNFGKGEAD